MYFILRGFFIRYCLFNYEFLEGEVNVGIRYFYIDEKFEKK